MPSREVRLSADYDISDYLSFRLNYLDNRRMRPFPNTKVFVGDELKVQVNALGGWGAEVEPGLQPIGFFGDSVVQGVGDSFANYVSVPGHQSVNFGVEGSQLHQIVDWCCDVNAKHPLAASIVHPGFHNLLYNETSFPYWEEQFKRLRDLKNVALCRLTADINAESAARGYDSIHGENYGVMHHSKDQRTSAAFLEAISRKNRLIEKACATWGFLMIDLDEVLAPATYGDVGRKFFDVLHPQPAMYPAMGASVSRQLRAYFPDAAGAQPAEALAAFPAERGRVYPLW